MIYRVMSAWVLTSIFSPTLLCAAEIHSSPVNADTTIIEISGSIEIDDDQKFRNAAGTYRNALVVLSSFGGRTNPAFEIGKVIRDRGYKTIVAEQTVCASACALIWLAGEVRFATPSSRIGFHASSISEGSSVRETGMGNALVGRYLTLLGYSQAAIVYVTFAPPDQILWLTDAPYDVSQIRYEAVGSLASVSTQLKGDRTDDDFRKLFNSWKRLDQLQQAMESIPSAQPMSAAGKSVVVRGFNVGRDEYDGGGVAHRGVDLTTSSEAPVYATANGVVSKMLKFPSGLILIEINHNKGIATRYAGLSANLSAVGSVVSRGQMIGLAAKANNGPTQIHYEVLLDGKVVDPAPFLRVDAGSYSD